MKNLTNIKIYGILVVIAVVLGFTASVKCSVIFFGLFHLLLWANISVANICNSIIAKENSANDNLYKILCILIASICFAIFL